MFSPLDEELELLPGQLSPALADCVARLGTTMPFAQGRVLLKQMAGARISVATLRRQTLRQGQAAVEVETGAVEILEEGTTEPLRGPASLQLSVDGAMVPLIGGKWAEVRTVACGELERDRTGNLRATNLSYFSRLTDHASFSRLATLEMHRRGVERAGQVVAVNDGADWIQQFIDLHAPRAIRVLDFSHASAYVHAVGHALAEGSCGGWCEARLSELAEGDPMVVLTTLKGLGASLAEEHPARIAAQHSLAYLAKREEQIQYHRFRADQLPIGSGIVESANKLLVEARCKGAGMHWRPENVNHILALRCADQSAHWETTTACAQEHLRLSRVQARQTAQRERRAKRRRKITRADRPPAPETARRSYFDAHGHPTNDHPFKRYRAISPRHAKL